MQPRAIRRHLELIGRIAQQGVSKQVSDFSVHVASVAWNVRRDKRKEKVDKTAAAILLQSYLDSLGGPGMA